MKLFLLEKRKNKIIDNFMYLDDWNEKYLYLISLGKKLKKFPIHQKIPQNMVSGCQSNVWFYSNINQHKKIIINATSDSIIVSGILGMIIEIYSDSFPEEIIHSNTNFIQLMGLSQHLSSVRNNGILSILDYIYKIAGFYHSKA